MDLLLGLLAKLTWWPRKVILQHLPTTLKEKYPTTISIVDASEIYIETPTDLYLQSSTWLSYKHYNTAKFLIACTPNGAVSFISDLYMGSISDKELTQKSGLLQLLKDVQASSVMADRGFLIDDDLNKIVVGLNIPPFLEGKGQFHSKEAFEGQKIASLRIRVERCIGRIKNFAILFHIPITLSRLANPTLKVCPWLTNFQPPLVPPSPESVAIAVDTNPSPLDSTDVASTSSTCGTGITPLTPGDCTADTEYPTDDVVMCLFLEQADCVDFSTFSDFEHD